MKFTEGGFRKWGYEVAKDEFGDQTVAWAECGGKAPAGKLLVKDVIADNFLQQILITPGGLRRGRHHEPQRRLHLRRPRRPGGRARHRARGQHQLRHRPRRASRPPTAPPPSIAGQDKVNPGSVILSGVMMLDHLGWSEAARLIETGPRAGHRGRHRDLRPRAAHARGGTRRRARGALLRVRDGDHRQLRRPGAGVKDGRRDAMARTAKLELDGKIHRTADHRGHRGRARHRHQQPARQDRLHHLRRRLRQHRLLPERDHLHRRREGHPALPRHPHRGTGREVHLRRGGLPAHLRASCPPRPSCGASPTC